MTHFLGICDHCKSVQSFQSEEDRTAWEETHSPCNDPEPDDDFPMAW